MLDPKSDAKQLVDYHNRLINRNIEYRQAWENDCKLVSLSYKGNKYPVLERDQSSSNRIVRETNKNVYLNMIKRQYRVMANYLTNNEPTYLITGGNNEFRPENAIQVNALLDSTFDGPIGDFGENPTTFYESQMDDVVFYGLQRWLCYTLAWFDSEENRVRFSSYDPLDTFIDIDTRKISQTKDFIQTYTKSKTELSQMYEVDADGKPIKWEDVNTDKDPSLSDAKKCLLKETDPKDSLIVREGYHVVFENGKPYVMKVITTAWYALEKKEFRQLKFIPISPFTPAAEPDDKYPRSWYSDMLQLDRKINEIVAKFSKIVDTGGRYVYVRKGTKLSPGSDKFLNKLGIEIIEVSDAQEVPQQANLMTISQQDIYFLDFLMKQAEEEGGMKSDIMGSSSLGAEASGRAIQALQAGSKNNMGQALNELNKYMSRLVRIVIELYKIHAPSVIEAYSKQSDGIIEVQRESLENVNVRVGVTARNAFDEITQQQNAVQMLEFVARLAPDANISPETITKILGLDNKIADDIQRDIDKQENPDAQMAEAENQKMMQAQLVNASETDDHGVHMAIHSEMLKSFPPESDAGQTLIKHMQMHEAFGSTLQE